MSVPATGIVCRELVELVTDYLEGALPSEDVRRFEGHLEICTACVSYLEQMRTTIRVTGRAQAVGLAPEAEEALLRAFADWKS